MRSWLRQELKDLSKAYELRLKEATELVTAYALGELTPEEADERNWRYHQRWGEALPGVSSTEAVTDEQILAAIDKARGSYSTPRNIDERYRKLFGRSPDQPGYAR